MFKLYFIVGLLLIRVGGFAQDKKDTTSYFPDLPPGITTINFNKINTEIVFPREAIKEAVHTGVVYCSFKIDKKGRLYQISIEKSSNRLFEKYAIKYLEGFHVAVKTTQVGIPFTIKLVFKTE